MLAATTEVSSVASELILFILLNVLQLLFLPESPPQNERNTPSPIDPDCVEVEVNFNPDPADLVLSSVPGGELFNPRKHKFTEEDLKPQPMIKKAKKVFVPDEQKVTDLLLQTSLGCDQNFSLFDQTHSHIKVTCCTYMTGGKHCRE